MSLKLNALLIGITLLGSFGAQAEERLISDGYARDVRGGQVIDVLRELRIGGGRTMVNSVFVIASTEKGRGTLEVISNGRLLLSKQIGVVFESVQVPIHAFVGREIRDIQVRFKGNFNLAMLAAAIDDHIDGPGGTFPGGGHGGGNGGGHGGGNGGGHGGGYPPMPRR